MEIWIFTRWDGRLRVSTRTNVCRLISDDYCGLSLSTPSSTWSPKGLSWTAGLTLKNSSDILKKSIEMMSAPFNQYPLQNTSPPTKRPKSTAKTNLASNRRNAERTSLLVAKIKFQYCFFQVHTFEAFQHWKFLKHMNSSHQKVVRS